MAHLAGISKRGSFKVTGAVFGLSQYSGAETFGQLLDKSTASSHFKKLLHKRYSGKFGSEFERLLRRPVGGWPFRASSVPKFIRKAGRIAPGAIGIFLRVGDALIRLDNLKNELPKADDVAPGRDEEYVFPAGAGWTKECSNADIIATNMIQTFTHLNLDCTISGGEIRSAKDEDAPLRQPVIPTADRRWYQSRQFQISEDFWHYKTASMWRTTLPVTDLNYLPARAPMQHVKLETNISADPSVIPLGRFYSQPVLRVRTKRHTQKPPKPRDTTRITTGDTTTVDIGSGEPPVVTKRHTRYRDKSKKGFVLAVAEGPKWARELVRALGHFSELADAVEAVFHSLPEEARNTCGNPTTPQGQFACLVNNKQRVDIGKAFVNLVLMEAIDQFVGRTAKKINKAGRKLGFNRNITFGFVI